MPHLIIETTADIAAAPGYEAQELIRAGLGALQGIGEYDMSSAKARARVLEDFAVDHPHDGTGFVAVQLRVLPGRSQELKTRTAEAILEAVAKLGMLIDEVLEQTQKHSDDEAGR